MEKSDEREVIKTIRCIVCPTGCEIEVKEIPDGEIVFEGYTCKRGLEYAKQEFSEPKRILTTTIRVDDALHPLIPVRTDKPLIKQKLNEALKIMARTIVNAPIKMGDILIENITNEEVNIIASRDLKKCKNIIK